MSERISFSELRISFDELQPACILRAAFQEFLDRSPLMKDEERTRVMFFGRWEALPDVMKAAVIVAPMIESRLCDNLPEIQPWTRARAVDSRLN